MIKICVESRAIGSWKRYLTRTPLIHRVFYLPLPRPLDETWGGCDHRIEPLMFAATIFLASVHGKCLCYTEDVDVVFTKKNSLLLIKLWNMDNESEMLCDS